MQRHTYTVRVTRDPQRNRVRTIYQFEVVDETGEVVDTCTGYWSEDDAWEAGNVVAVTLTRQAQSLNPPLDYEVARLTG